MKKKNNQTHKAAKALASFSKTDRLIREQAEENTRAALLQKGRADEALAGLISSTATATGDVQGRAARVMAIANLIHDDDGHGR